MTEPTLLNPSDVAASLIGGAPAAPVAPPVTSPPPAAETQPAAEPAVPVATPTPDGQIDKAGRVFDAARYKTNPDGTPFRNRLGYFMPRGGRKAASVAAPAPAVSAPVNMAPVLPPEPAAPAWSEAAKAVAGAVPKLPGEPGAEAATPASSTAPGVDCSDDAAEVAARALYLVMGVMTGADDEATPAKSEHENLHKAAAAYIRQTGWRGSALACAIIAICAYVLRVFQRPKSAAWLRSQIGRVWKRQPVAAAIPVAPSPAPAAAKPAVPASQNHSAVPFASGISGLSERSA